MCGIIAYVGDKDAYPILVEGLRRLEYRGYDSSGVSLLHDGILMLTHTSLIMADLPLYIMVS